jgi:hypothetical protein
VAVLSLEAVAVEAQGREFVVSLGRGSTLARFLDLSEDGDDGTGTRVPVWGVKNRFAWLEIRISRRNVSFDTPQAPGQSIEWAWQGATADESPLPRLHVFR